MALIPFPNVPALAGVPLLLRAPTGSISGAVSGLLQGALFDFFSTNAPQWGVWDVNGNPVGDNSLLSGIIGTLATVAGIGSTLSTYSVDYRKETKLSDFPVEGGGFFTYNKVETPADAAVTLCLQGTESDRTFFLNAIDSACKSTDPYTVATPEVQYINYMIESYNYSRKNSNGATLLIVELKLKEVRAVSALYTQSSQSGTAANPAPNPSTPSAAAPVQSGNVQAQTPQQSVALQIYNKVFN